MGRSTTQQNKYIARIAEIVHRVKAGEFENHKALVKAYGRKTGSFASKAKRSAICLGLITLADWKASFPAPGKRVQVWKCPGCGLRYQNKSRYDAELSSGASVDATSATAKPTQ